MRINATSACGAKGFLAGIGLVVGITQGLHAQRLFKVEPAVPNSGYTFFYQPNDGKTYYNLVYQGNPVLKGSGAAKPDTLRLLQELLRFQGDTRLCMSPATVTHCAICSSIYTGSQKNYSIQVEALYRINQLCLGKFALYNHFPVLRSRRSGKTETIGGEIVNQAYQAYRNWLNKVRVIGLNQARKQRILPLDNSPVSWF